MSDLLEELRTLAFSRAASSDANEAIARVREARAKASVEATSYELALPGLAPESWLLERALPKLAYFLDCRGVRLPGSGGVFVSLFMGDGLLFLEAGPFVEAMARRRGLSLDEVRRRYGANGTGEPPLLGGG